MEDIMSTATLTATPVGATTYAVDRTHSEVLVRVRHQKPARQPILARDGSLFVTWFSARAGNDEVYITRTVNGTAWTPPVRVTFNGEGDLYSNHEG
jgi:hypothetical protein